MCLTAQLVRTQGQQAVSHCITGEDTGSNVLPTQLVRTQGQQCLTCTTGEDTGTAMSYLHNYDQRVILNRPEQLLVEHLLCLVVPLDATMDV